MLNKKILITGSSGMLGSEISFSDKYNCNYISTSLNPIYKNHLRLDITNSHNVKEILDKYKPDVIINCAAYTDVDKAENNKSIAHKINVEGLSNLIKYSNHDTKIVQISTDYVFDGCNAPYFEDSNTFPLNYYGKTKLEAENLLIGSNRSFLILRPNVLFSYKGNNFFTFVYNMLCNNKKINIVDDQISNPTYVPSFSKIIHELILLENVGVFHYGCNESISRYDFALKIADFFNFNKKLINKVSSSYFETSVNRPFNSTLKCDKIVNSIDMYTDRIEDNLISIQKKI